MNTMIKKILIISIIISSLFIATNNIYADDHKSIEIQRFEEEINKEIDIIEQKIRDIQTLYRSFDERVSPEAEYEIMELRYDIDMLNFQIKLKKKGLL